MSAAAPGSAVAGLAAPVAIMRSGPETSQRISDYIHVAAISR
jgi:hypothetical protein